LSFTSAHRHATNGIYLNKHLRTVLIHSTISDLFSLSTNHKSLILQCYHHLLPQIAEIVCPPTTPRMDLAHYYLTTLSPHSACGRLKKHCTHTVKSELYMFEHKRADFHLLPGIFLYTNLIPHHRNDSKCHQAPPLTTQLPHLHQTQTTPPNLSTKHTLHMYLATTPSAMTKVVRNGHTTLSLMTLLLSYTQHWRNQDTSTQAPNWTLKCTYTSDLTPPHNRLTYPSTQTPPPTTAAPIQPSAQTSPLQEPHRPQNTKHLKTSSKQSLPTQTTIFKCMNDANLDTPPNQQQLPPHLYMATKSSANYTTKTWSSSSQSRLIPLPILVQCSNHF